MSQTRDVQIRAADLTDAARITEFNQALAQESEGRALQGDLLASGVLAVLHDERRGRYFVALRAGQLVGQLMLTREWSDWRNGWFWWIQSVYVAPEARGLGVYRALHEHVQALARKQPDVCGIRLYVEQNNPAQRVYEKLGMTRTHYHLYEIDFRPP